MPRYRLTVDEPRTIHLDENGERMSFDLVPNEPGAEGSVELNVVAPSMDDLGLSEHVNVEEVEG